MHILHILCIYCILSAYYFTYYFAYFAYRIAGILCIFAYYFAYLMHIILHILMHILHISVDAYCAYSTHCTLHIVHIVHILDEKVIQRVFIVHCHYCFVPHPRAQLFTYHHLQPSPPFADLSQKAPGKSAVSRRMAKGIVPVAPTGTRGRRPSMEDTGITYKTCQCACSRRS